MKRTKGEKRLARIEEAILDLAYWVSTKDKGILHGDEDIYQRVANLVFGPARKAAPPHAKKVEIIRVVPKPPKPARGRRKK